MDRKEIIRTIYLYIFSIVGLVLVIIGSVRFIDLGLKKYVFKKAEQNIIYPAYPVKPSPALDGKTDQVLTPEEQEKYNREQREAEEKQRESQRARTASESLAMIVVGVPLFGYHWKTIQKSRKS